LQAKKQVDITWFPVRETVGIGEHNTNEKITTGNPRVDGSIPSLLPGNTGLAVMQAFFVFGPVRCPS
jgi:hypothetical protein